MRAEHVHEAVRQLRELVVELLPDAAGQEREALEQALDVGVRAGLAEVARHVRARGRELRSHLAQPREFVLVVLREHVGQVVTVIRP